MAMCAIAGLYGLGLRLLACRYRLFSQPVFPAKPAFVHFCCDDDAPRQRLIGEGQVMNIHAPLRLENTTRPLDGRVSLITGSTSGIGLGIARALAAAGSAVVLNGFGKPEDIAEAQAKLVSDFGVKAKYSPADMSKPGPIADMIAMTLDTFGRLDVLVNNAGIQSVAPIEQFPVEKWDAILAINLSSAFHTTRAALPSMRKKNFGRIINIASAHGLIASPFKAAYVAAKHGIVGLTKVIALETAEANITCNAICPGYVYTPLVEAQIDGQAKSHGIPREQVIRDVLLAQQPNKRFATVEELGAFSVFLASDAAVSITGTALPVDGGWTAH
jgi:3-hydroxybutyrate dehydrogenase